MRAPLVLAAIAVSLSANTAAAESPVQLDFRREVGAEACPDEQEFRDALSAHLKQGIIAPAAPDRLVVRLQGKGRWHRGAAELRDEKGGVAWSLAFGPIPDCVALADNLALAIAIKIDPHEGRKAPTIAPSSHRIFGVDGEVLPMPEPAVPPSAPAPPPPPAPPSPSLPRDLPPPLQEPPPAVRVRLGAFAGVALGTLPALGPIVALDVGLRWRDLPLSVALEGSFATPISADLMSGPHLVHVSAYRGTGAGIACGHFLRFVVACGKVVLGAVHATATATALVAEPVTVFYAGVGPRVGAEFPLGTDHLLARVSGEVLVTLARPELQAGGMSVWEMPLASGTIGGGLVAAF